MLCVNTLHKDDQYTAQAGLVFTLPTTRLWEEAFQRFQPESRRDFRDSQSAAKLSSYSGTKQLSTRRTKESESLTLGDIFFVKHYLKLK